MRIVVLLTASNDGNAILTDFLLHTVRHVAAQHGQWTSYRDRGLI